MGRERLRDEVIGWGALLLFAAVGSTLILGCHHGGDGPRVDPVFQAEVSQALDAIEQHGLADWADWGRAHRAIVVNNEALVPADCLGYTWAFRDTSGGETLWQIALGSKWRRLAVRERGLVLLHELWHVRAGDLGHPVELWQLLDQYSTYQETR